MTSPLGFLARATEAAVKYRGRLDLVILYSERPCASTSVFTGNRDIEPYLTDISIGKLADLKRCWKVSMAALLEC